VLAWALTLSMIAFASRVFDFVCELAHEGLEIGELVRGRRHCWWMVERVALKTVDEALSTPISYVRSHPVRRLEFHVCSAAQRQTLRFQPLALTCHCFLRTAW